MTTLSTIVTWNLLFKGVIGGMITAVVAMGIVLVYRSSRVINFAVGNMGVPATALFAIMAGKHGWPYWPALFGALLVGTLTGTVIELTVIRRLFLSPRVIVLVATIGVAQLCEAVTLSLPEYRTGSLQTQFPLPFSGEWHPFLDITVSASQLLVLIVVPVITVGLWWLLGHTAFGDAVRASATNVDLARMTGISPKLVSTAVWSIAGFLATVAVLLTASDQGSTDLIHIGPDTLLRGMAAALIGGMVSFPRAALGAILIGIFDRVLFFNYTTETGLVQFLLFIVVLVLVARVSRRDAQAAGESFQFAPRVAAVPERLKSIWWVRRMPQLIAGFALIVALDRAAALGRVGSAPDVDGDPRVRAMRGVGRRADGLGWSALTRADGVRGSRRADRRGPVTRHVREHRLARHPHHQWFAPCHHVPVDAPPRRGRCEPRRGARRHRGAPRTRPAARHQHARVRDRVAGLPVRPSVLHGRAVDGPDPARRHRAARTHAQEPRVLLLRPVRTRRGVAVRRPSPPYRGRAHDRRRARERTRGGRDDRVGRAHQADRVRARGVRRGPRWRPARRGEPHVRPGRALLPRRRFAARRFDRGDRRPREPHGRGRRRAVGHRAARVLAQQQPRAAVHVEHRIAADPPVHPGRLRADRLLRARLVAALGRETAPTSVHGEDGEGTAGFALAHRATPPGDVERRRHRARDARPHGRVRWPHRGQRRVVPRASRAR